MPSSTCLKNQEMAWLTAFLQPRLRGLNKVRTSLCQSTVEASSRTFATRSASAAFSGRGPSTAKKICDGLTGRSASKTRAVVSGRLKARSKRSEEHTSELQSQSNLVCRLLLEKKKK